MGIVARTENELDLVPDAMEDDRIRITKLRSGGVQILIFSPQGGVDGAPMTAATELTAAEWAAVKAFA